MSTIQAGVSRKTITPPRGIHLMGYGNRVQGNIGAHDDLYVTTLVLEAAGTRAALLAVDHTFINTVYVDKVKERIHDLCGITPDAVFVCCSHTHGGPIGYADDHSPPEDQAYMAFLVRMLAESAEEAVGTMVPVRLQAGTAEANININRRELTADGRIIIGHNPDGPVDRSVQVLSLMIDNKTPLATLVNYACHPVVMGPLNRQVTADWVGVMRRDVEQSLGGYCLFFQGATADINPRQMRWTVDNWDEIESQGSQVATAVQEAYRQKKPLNVGPIRAKQTACWLPLMPPGSYSEQLREFLPPNVRTDEDIQRTIRAGFPWYTAIEARSDGLYSPIYIGSLCVGDWALATLGTEPFTETGMAIKAASPAKMTFVAGYTNGCNSYLPVESAYDTGGYEVETAAIFYGLPAGFAPGGAEIVTAAIVKLLHS